MWERRSKKRSRQEKTWSEEVITDHCFLFLFGRLSLCCALQLCTHEHTHMAKRQQKKKRNKWRWEVKYLKCCGFVTERLRLQLLTCSIRDFCWHCVFILDKENMTPSLTVTITKLHIQLKRELQLKITLIINFLIIIKSYLRSRFGWFVNRPWGRDWGQWLFH